ncbi:hypothetical protein E2C01_096205 [Portunus trituberculatus]|uniref:Uncharacterized protein n=1 Tax=Portunus trituberculatus TaxID=210409 RepID=A0A5B7JS25_PORTR|nr:hypothetical protein [Portunus trituberculatus]
MRGAGRLAKGGDPRPIPAPAPVPLLHRTDTAPTPRTDPIPHPSSSLRRRRDHRQALDPTTSLSSRRVHNKGLSSSSRWARPNGVGLAPRRRSSSRAVVVAGRSTP